MPWIMVDIEADGPIPGDYSMVSFGAVVVGYHDKTFKGELRPISDKWIPEALAVSGYSREKTMEFDQPIAVMVKFRDWLQEICAMYGGKPMLISDNNGFDAMFMSWYFHHFLGDNPFGHSSTNLGSLYKGMVKDTSKNFKHLRSTKHTHDPVDDAMGNCEALLRMRKEMGLGFRL